MKNKKGIIFKIIFNVVETILIFDSGLRLNLDWKDILFIMFLFAFSKISLGKSLHYKDWYKCLIISLAIMYSLFFLLKFSFIQSSVLTIFCAYIMTTRGNIKEELKELNDNLYHWSGKSSKYDALIDVVSNSPNNPTILDYEEYWRKNYPLRYEIFKLFYRERKSYSEIREIKNYDENNFIKSECKSIYEQLEKPLGLPPIKK